MRMVRYTNSMVGRFPAMPDFSDYRDANGAKLPFKWTYSWLDGRESFELTDVQMNAAIDSAKFAKPAPVASKYILLYLERIGCPSILKIGLPS